MAGEFCIPKEDIKVRAIPRQGIMEEGKGKGRRTGPSVLSNGDLALVPPKDVRPLLPRSVLPKRKAKGPK